MEQIIIIIVCLWWLCALLSFIIYDYKKDVDKDWTVIALFPANLICVLKAFWKSIIKAIKS